MRKDDASGLVSPYWRTTKRAAKLARLILMAEREKWRARKERASTQFGYPMVNVRDIESGQVRATLAMFGAD